MGERPQFRLLAGGALAAGLVAARRLLAQGGERAGDDADLVVAIGVGDLVSSAPRPQGGHGDDRATDGGADAGADEEDGERHDQHHGEADGDQGSATRSTRHWRSCRGSRRRDGR